ncbi:MAG: sulfite exporter TauE/SafE family protein [Devosia sp.]
MALSLIGLSLVTSLITATFSLGGGTLMIAVLALAFPPAIVVPIHGCVQLGSNAGRALVQRAHIQWHLIVWISLGAIVGIVVGGQFIKVLPEQLFTLAIAVFVLITTWLPQPKIVGENRAVQFVGGAIISALSMVVGATGPLVATFIRGLADRRQLVATHAMLMTIQNTFKVLTFTALGFAFGAYLPLIAAMIVSGFVGTAIGSRLLVKVPEHIFRVGFKIVLTLVALDLIREALF